MAKTLVYQMYPISFENIGAMTRRVFHLVADSPPRNRSGSSSNLAPKASASIRGRNLGSITLIHVSLQTSRCWIWTPRR